ncbi:hypothetical protein T01_3822 [Trichinella spiralis]|uniref:Uncharacterized protein n=1 Tax=Trichinella spiralis TaxID=6334 RepID=A0A0V0ZJ57_TRISP|nr:hypothetical protein T01_3822 [Trichinella spiralis]
MDSHKPLTNRQSVNKCWRSNVQSTEERTNRRPACTFPLLILNVNWLLLYCSSPPLRP